MSDLDVLRYAREIQRGGRDVTEVALALLETAGCEVRYRYKVRAPDGLFFSGGDVWARDRASSRSLHFNTTGREWKRVGDAKSSMTIGGRHAGPNFFDGCEIVKKTIVTVREQVVHTVPTHAPIPPPRPSGDSVCHNCDRPGWVGKLCDSCGVQILGVGL